MAFAIHQHESATGILVSPYLVVKPLLPPSPPYPSGLSQSNDFGCSASCIELALVMHFIYGNIHVAKIFSQIILLFISNWIPLYSENIFVIFQILKCIDIYFIAYIYLLPLNICM